MEPIVTDDFENTVARVVTDPERLAALRETALMDSPSEEAFDRLTRLAARILDVPVALISLVDDERHFFKSSVGMPANYHQRPLADSFCHYTMALGHPLVIEDARDNPLVRDNPATIEFGIGGYLGIPLCSEEGLPLGNFCVLDHEPRDWSNGEVEAVNDLATSVMAEIELRAANRRSEAARQKAEAAVLARDETLAVVSHDLRSPLSSIVLNTQLLRDSSLPEAERAKRLAVIERSAERMDRLIQDLLDISCLEAGGFSVEPEPLQVPPLIDDLVESLEPAAEDKMVKLETSDHDAVPPVLADCRYLMRVFENLVRNAVEYTPEGGRVGISSEDAGEHVRFSVSDTGPGVPEDQHSQLFERFFRAQRSDRQGAGLGLPIARGIIEAHGGEIWCESEAGSGATFYFTVPKSSSTPA